MPTYSPRNKELRSTPDIAGDENRAIHITRARIPQQEIADVFSWCKDQLASLEILDNESIESLEGIGSTRQYLHEGYEKPYAGDIDAIIRLPVDQEQIDTYVEEVLIPAFEEADITYHRSFGNISIFFPVETEASETPLHIQVDIMLVPTSSKDAVFKYLTEIRYFSGEPYQEIEGQGYIKGVHTAHLVQTVLQTKNYLMDNIGIYQNHYEKDFRSKHIHQALSVLTEKSASRVMPKLRQHLNGLNSWVQEGLPLAGQIVQKDDVLGPIATSDLYPEVRSIIVNRKYIQKNPKSFLKGLFGKNDIATFERTLNTLHFAYQKGNLTEEEIQTTFTNYGQDLVGKNKDTIWFPFLKEKILEHFPFVDFTEVDQAEVEKRKRELARVQ